MMVDDGQMTAASRGVVQGFGEARVGERIKMNRAQGHRNVVVSSQKGAGKDRQKSRGEGQAHRGFLHKRRYTVYNTLGLESLVESSEVIHWRKNYGSQCP